MKKLRLDLDGLQVETFAPEAAPPGERGTVRGNAVVGPVGGTLDCVATQPNYNSAYCPISDPVRETEQCLTYNRDTCLRSCPQLACGSESFDSCYGAHSCDGSICTKMYMCV